MKLIALSCEQCGAPLEVPVDRKHVSCVHCGTALAVKQQGSVLFTEKIESLENRTSSMESELDQMRIEDALKRLDQQWESERTEFSLSLLTYPVIIPTHTLGCFVGSLIMVAAFAVGYLLNPFAGIVIAVGGFIAGSHILTQADHYEKAMQAYVDQRDDIRRGKLG